MKKRRRKRAGETDVKGPTLQVERSWWASGWRFGGGIILGILIGILGTCWPLSWV